MTTAGELAKSPGDARWQVETLCGEPIADRKHRPVPWSTLPRKG